MWAYFFTYFVLTVNLCLFFWNLHLYITTGKVFNFIVLGFPITGAISMVMTLVNWKH